jgi:hypothetical protein
MTTLEKGRLIDWTREFPNPIRDTRAKGQSGEGFQRAEEKAHNPRHEGANRWAMVGSVTRCYFHVITVISNNNASKTPTIMKLSVAAHHGSLRTLNRPDLPLPPDSLYRTELVMPNTGECRPRLSFSVDKLSGDLTSWMDHSNPASPICCAPFCRLVDTILPTMCDCRSLDFVYPCLNHPIPAKFAREIPTIWDDGKVCHEPRAGYGR